jgi:hypothetical protein
LEKEVLRLLKSKYYKQAFEIENVQSRKNYSYVYNPFDQSVCCYDTSINQTPSNKRIMAFKDEFPFECKTAHEYFAHMYNRSTSMQDLPWCFLGWVYPANFKPIEHEEFENEQEWETTLKSKLNDKHNEFKKLVQSEEIWNLINENSFITGGCIASFIREEQPKDIDYFITNTEALNKIKEYFKARDEIRLEYQREHHRPITVLDGFDDVPLFFTDNAITLCDGFQIILKDCGDPEEVVGKFDYVHCMGYYMPNKNQLNVTDETRVAATDHRLIYNVMSESPISSSYRMVKFIERGWKISRHEQAKLLLNVNTYELSEHEEENMSDIKYYEVE